MSASIAAAKRHTAPWGRGPNLVVEVGDFVERAHDLPRDYAAEASGPRPVLAELSATALDIG